MIVDYIREDTELQKSIRSMMKQPGVKKSVNFGTPYAITKDGQRLRLVPDDTYTQKSVVDKNMKFGEVYKNNFSSQFDRKRK